jgi:uncharacterized protein
LTGEPALDFISRGVEMSNAAGTPWENYITLQSFFHLSSVEPHNYLPKIDPTKLLYIAAEQDPITGTLEEHRVNFGTVKPGAEFAVVKPDHLATYHGKAFEEMIAVQVDFLKRKLK